MSFLDADRMKVLAESLDIDRLSNPAAKALAPHIEVRLREVVQEASKFARHSKRAKLSTSDINNALKLRNVEPTYGFASKDALRFLKAANQSDLFYVEDPVVSLDQVIDKPLPKCPAEVGVALHWLAIDGVQPTIPENAALGQPPPKRRRTDAPVTALAAPGIQQQVDQAEGGDRSGQARTGKAGEAATVQLPLAHVLSRELQTYYDRVSSVLLLKTAEGGVEPADAGGAARMQLGIFASLASDPGLQPLVPYFMRLVAQEVPKQLQSLPHLRMLLRAARSLLANSDLNLGPYIHVLMPALLSCVLAKRMGGTPSEDHWSVRDAAARVIALACARLGPSHPNMQPRVTREYSKALTDDAKPLATRYGAIVGLAALGEGVVRQLLVPHLAPFLQTLQPDKADSLPPGQARQWERHRVMGAACQAACSCLFAAARKELAAGTLQAAARGATSANPPGSGELTSPKLQKASSERAPGRNPAARTASITANPPLAPRAASGHSGQQAHPAASAAAPADQAPPSPVKRSSISSPSAADALAQPPAGVAPVATSRRVTRGSSAGDKAYAAGAESAASPRGNASPTRRLTRRASGLAARKDSGLASPTDSPHSAYSEGGGRLALRDGPPSTSRSRVEPAEEAAGTSRAHQHPPAPAASARGGGPGGKSAKGADDAGATAGEVQQGGADGDRVSEAAKTALAGAWREDADPGRALMALRELFGQPLMPHFWAGRLADIIL